MTETPTKLPEAIDRIDLVDDDDISTLTFHGFARSRSDNNLHLAIATGVIAIPLKSIVEVTPTSTANSVFNDSVVSVRVRNAGEVKYVMPMAPQGHVLSTPAADLFNSPFRSKYPPGDDDLPPVYGPGVSTLYCTSTHTDGNACDDCECNSYPDDLAQ